MSEENKDFAEAEAGVLGCLLLGSNIDEDNTARMMGIAETAGVTEDWFRELKHKRVWAALIAAWRKWQRLDLYQVKDFYDESGGVPKFVEMFEALTEVAPTTAHFEYYLWKLKRKAAYARIHKTIAEAMSEMTPDNIDVAVEDLARKLIDASDNLATGDQNDLKPLAAFMAESIEKKRRLHEERFVKHNWEYMDGLPWPWHAMNTIFAGLKTGLHVIGALTSDGKSTIAANLSAFWNERGIKHGYFSIDMASDGMADRYPCIAGRVSLAKLNFGGSADDVAKFEAAFKRQADYGNVTLSEEDNVKRIGIKVARGVRSLGWKAIIIDYIQLLTAEEKGQMPEYTRVQRVVQEAKRVAKKHKIPLICLAQLSRAFEKELREKGGEPGTDAIGDSAEIARAAASITVLYKDADMVKYWKQNPPVKLAFADPDDMALKCRVLSVADESEEDREQRHAGQLSLAKALRPMWVDVIKNQQGGKAKVPFVMFPNYFLFRPGNIEGEDREVQIEGKTKKLPIGKFEAICDDWTYTDQDWWLEMTGAIPMRGCKLMGETYAQMRERIERERERHPEVKQFVREYDAKGNEIGWHFMEAGQ